MLHIHCRLSQIHGSHSWNITDWNVLYRNVPWRMRLHRHRDTRLEKRKHLAVTPIYITQKRLQKNSYSWYVVWCLNFFSASLSFCELRDCLDAKPLGNAGFGVHQMFATVTTSSDENLWRELHTCNLQKFLVMKLSQKLFQLSCTSLL